MKTIIAGSRDLVDPRMVEWAVEQSGFQITEIVSGGARGVDTLAIEYAGRVGLPCKVFYAAWRPYPDDPSIVDRGAGLKRNCQMADYSDALVAIWNGRSRGTKHMIETAKKAGLSVYVERVTLTPPDPYELFTASMEAYT